MNPKRVEELFPEDWKRYVGIKDKIIELMGEADILAKKFHEDE